MATIPKPEAGDPPRYPVNFMKIVRRVHLFAGLFMLPWVLVYGISALAFNHGNWFFPVNSRSATQPRDIRELPDSFWSNEALKPAGSASLLARNVLDAINHQEAADRRPGEWQLADDSQPRFSRNLVLGGVANGRLVEYQLNLNQRSGTVEWAANTKKTRPAYVAEAKSFKATNAAVFDDALGSALGADLGKINESTNALPATLVTKSVPELVFSAVAEGRHWNVRCNLATGEASATEAGARLGFVATTASFMTALHKSRGYPSDGSLSVRWWWAVIVDATAFLMLVWGISGLAMWWQIKAQRKWGIITLAICGIMSWLIWTGMHHAMR